MFIQQGWASFYMGPKALDEVQHLGKVTIGNAATPETTSTRIAAERFPDLKRRVAEIEKPDGVHGGWGGRRVDSEIPARILGLGTGSWEAFFHPLKISTIGAYRPFPKTGEGWQIVRMGLPANQILGRNLRECRGENNISVIDLVKAVDIDQRYYTRIEGGEENPSLNVLTRINGFLEIPWERLMPPIGCLCQLLPYHERRCRNRGASFRGR